MKIQSLILREVCIPLRFQFSQANNADTRTSHSAILEIYTDEGIVGYGEACPRLYVTGESRATIKADLERFATTLKSQSFESVEQIEKILNELTVGNSTRCALELALLDAFSRTTNQSLSQLFGSSNDKEINYSLILPLLKTEQLERLLPKINFIQPPAIKLKVDHQLDNSLSNIKAIQSHFGAHLPVRVDVNGGWTLKEAKLFIPQCMALGIHSFEQPLAADNLDGMKELTALFGETTRLMLDESLLTMEQATHYLHHQIGNHFNLKIAKLGGILPTMAICKMAEKFGVPCQLGAHFGETSILTKAGILLATLLPELTAHEGAMGTYLLEKDIIQPSIRFDQNACIQSNDYLRDDLGWGIMAQRNLQTYSTKIAEI